MQINSPIYDLRHELHGIRFSCDSLYKFYEAFPRRAVPVFTSRDSYLAHGTRHHVLVKSRELTFISFTRFYRNELNAVESPQPRLISTSLPHGLIIMISGTSETNYSQSLIAITCSPTINLLNLFHYPKYFHSFLKNHIVYKNITVFKISKLKLFIQLKRLIIKSHET